MVCVQVVEGVFPVGGYPYLYTWYSLCVQKWYQNGVFSYPKSGVLGRPVLCVNLVFLAKTRRMTIFGVFAKTPDLRCLGRYPDWDPFGGCPGTWWWVVYTLILHVYYMLKGVFPVCVYIHTVHMVFTMCPEVVQKWYQNGVFLYPKSGVFRGQTTPNPCTEVPIQGPKQGQTRSRARVSIVKGIL
jgi:hypothetical protein